MNHVFKDCSTVKAGDLLVPDNGAFAYRVVEVLSSDEDEHCEYEVIPTRYACHSGDVRIVEAEGKPLEAPAR